MQTMWNRAAQEQRREAERTALYQSWWRDWHRYVLAKAALLDHAATSAAPLPFEDGQDTTTEAETTLKRLPSDRRAVFDAAWSKALAEAEDAELNAARARPTAA